MFIDLHKYDEIHFVGWICKWQKRETGETWHHHATALFTLDLQQANKKVQSRDNYP